MINWQRWMAAPVLVAVLPGWFYRIKAAGLHFLLSGLLVAVAAVLVFRVWYPSPFHQVTGVARVFWMLTWVDWVLGPLLTLAAYAPDKRPAVRWRDMLVIAVLQLAAYAYGLSVMYAGRPVYLVHEVDRLHVLTASDLISSGAAPEAVVVGVLLMGVRDARDGADKLDAIEQALLGRDTFARPDWWTPVTAAYRARHESEALYASHLAATYPALHESLEECSLLNNVDDQAVVLFPLSFNGQDWWLLLDRGSWTPSPCVPVPVP